MNKFEVTLKQEEHGISLILIHNGGVIKLSEETYDNYALSLKELFEKVYKLGFQDGQAYPDVNS